MRKIKPGQIWTGKSLRSYEPNLQFIYVVLSHDKENGIGWWSVAVSVLHKKQPRGMGVHKFVDAEIHQLDYRGNVMDIL